MLTKNDYISMLLECNGETFAQVMYHVAMEPTYKKNGVFKQYDEIVLYFSALTDKGSFCIKGIRNNDKTDFPNLQTRVKNTIKGKVKRKN